MRILGFKAFSLVELMVVIAIVALLSAVAVPLYKTMVLKSKVGAAINYLIPGLEKIKQYYNIKGYFPSNPSDVLTQIDETWGSDGGSGGQYYLSSHPYINTVGFIGYYNGTTSPPARVNMSVSFKPNLGFEKVAGNSAFLTFTVYVDANGNLQTVCGNWDVNFEFQKIKPELLPPNCTATDLYRSTS